MRETETLVKNYGSHEVRRLLDQLGELVRKIEYADDLIRSVDQSAADESDELDQEAGRERRAMIDYKNDLYAVSEAIRDQMHKELAPDDPAIEAAPGDATALPSRAAPGSPA
jgi:hypothetical protein